MNMRTRFLHDVKDHQLIIRKDDDVYRHLHFSKPGTRNLSFSLITWPGYLAIAGDCEDYMFTRLFDMFDFFRYAGPGYQKEDRVNYGYWAEKTTSSAKHHGMTEFSESRYKEAVYQDFLGHTESMTPTERLAVWREVRADLMESSPMDEREAVDLAMGFRCPIDGSYPFDDFWDHRLTQPSFGFRWACHAIQWGIKRYDLYHQGRTQEQVQTRILKGLI